MMLPTREETSIFFNGSIGQGEIVLAYKGGRLMTEAEWRESWEPDREAASKRLAGILNAHDPHDPLIWAAAHDVVDAAYPPEGDG